MSKKLPRYSTLQTSDVFALPKVKEWFARKLEDRTPPMASELLVDNRARLKAVYGPRDQVHDAEERFDVWHIDQDELSFWLLSGKTVGTKIEIETPDVWEASYEDRIIEFLGDLLLEFRNI